MRELPEPVRQCLTDVQHDLFDLGGELCIPGTRVITPAYTQRLEDQLDFFNDPLPPLKEFILPEAPRGRGSSILTRTICRHTERLCWTLAREESVGSRTS